MSANFAQLSLGSDDKKAVWQLQTLLNENGANLVVDGVFGEKTDAAVRQYQKDNGLEADGVVGAKTWSMLISKEPVTNLATSVEEAESAWQNHVANTPGAFVFGDQMLLDLAQQAAANREDFTYDPNADAMYRYYKDRHVTQGRRAMEDTMGVAVTNTGGYGNSYAQSVGQQAYQGYLEKLGDVGQELYKLAYEKYQDETDRINREYDAWEQKKEAAYGEYQDQVKAHESTEQELYNRYQDALSRQEKAYTRLSALLKLGYIPTDAELAAAGMTRAMAQLIARG